MSQTKSERPDIVPDWFDRVSGSSAGYAVSDGDLWAADREAMLKLFSAGRAPSGATTIATRACRAAPDVPSSVSETVTQGWFRGDLSDLNALVDALNYYEKREAGIGEDKFAYEMRTALNHASPALKRQFSDE